MTPSEGVDAAGLIVVMSGLPASGKSTLGARLASLLGLEFVDKDDILEGLFDTRGVSHPEERTRLSREADVELVTRVRGLSGCVVATFWRHESMPTDSGTPPEWLTDLPGRDIVEVVCECSPQTAVARFGSRRRHVGHFDDRHDRATRLASFEVLSRQGPVTHGPAVHVSTEFEVDVTKLAREVLARRRAGAQPATD